MNLIPVSNLLTKEFEQVKLLSANYCLSSMGRDLILEMQPSSVFILINFQLNLVNDFKMLIDDGMVFPDDGYEEISKELSLLRIENSVLQPNQFRKIYTLTNTAFAIIRFFKNNNEGYDSLRLIAKDIEIKKEIISLIDDVFDESGIVKSSASPELAGIRKSLMRKRSEVDRMYQTIIQKYRKSGWVGETEESSRNGRRVVAIVAEQKRNLNGIIHDLSATGKTAYLEPAEVVELNNLVQSLENEERNEIMRILRELTAKIRQFQNELDLYFQMISVTDSVRARAYFAKSLHANLPFIKNEPVFNVSNARHPLLFLQNQQASKKTIPFNLMLDDESRIIVISGPNAGGKTVCMKTSALLQVMLQSGFLVSCDSHSTFGVFEKMLVDIGDAQSIEYELSTYSSRLKLMKEFLDEANAKTFFIIDEFGTGTDPELGGALAESILEELNNRKCFGLITTHYLNLKVAADRTPGLMNGSMAFDAVKLEPMYELIVGKPGSSYTFVVAERSGLPKHVVKNAQSKVSKNHVLLEQLLAQVEKDKTIVKNKLKELNSAEKTLTDLLERYERLSVQSENAAQKIEEKVRAAEMRLVKQFDDKLVKFLNEWKNSKDKKFVFEKYRNMYSKQKKEITTEAQLKQEKQNQEWLSKIKEGIFVRLKGAATIGKIERIQNTKATVVFGSIKTFSDVKQLIPVEDEEVPEKLKRK